jgi:hypothetical protein
MIRKTEKKKFSNVKFVYIVIINYYKLLCRATLHNYCLTREFITINLFKDTEHMAHYSLLFF